MSDYKCISDCRSWCHEFDPGPVPNFPGDWYWIYFYGRSPSFRWFIQEGLLLVTSKIMCTNYWLTACSSLPRKKVWLGELTAPHDIADVDWGVKQQNKQTQTYSKTLITGRLYSMHKYGGDHMLF